MKRKSKKISAQKRVPKKTSPKTKKAPQAKRSSSELVPLNDRVIVRPLSVEEMSTTTESGIIIPDSAKEKPEQGTVVAVGPGKYENGERMPVSVSVGDKVMFTKYGYDEIKVKGTTYYVISESNILAVINS